MNQDLVHKVKQAFGSQFGSPCLLINSPGRINLIGEHTDYNLGFVFPAAIDKGIICAMNHSNSSKCTISALDMNEVFELELDRLTIGQHGHWINYIIGVVSEIQKKGWHIKPFNMVFSGDIPKGAGLSSSAALENSIVFGLNELNSLRLSKMEMIHISQKAEHNYVGVNCGIMDQYASMFGEEDSALMIDCASLKAKIVKIAIQDYDIILVNSNVSHSLVDAAYNDRREVCEKVANLLNVEALRFANANDLLKLKSKISEEDYHKALYIIEENQRVIDAYKCLDEGDILGFGALLFEAHKGASEQFCISCPELDYLVAFSKAHPHVIGARMMGGGFGGCTINLVAKDRVTDFITAISEAYHLEFNKPCTTYKVQLSQGTHLIN
ncbi:galactokinase [Psychroserpens sp. BH13MA-6]